MKNIAIITSCLSKGGAERAAGLLSIQLSKYYNVYLFLIEDHPITYEYSGTIVNVHMTETYENRRKNFGPIGKLMSKTAYIDAVRKIKQLKKKYNIDYAISFLETPNLMNIFSKNKEKIIVSVRSTRSLQTETRISRIENAGIRKYYNKTNAVVALSFGVADDLITSFSINPNLVETIYNFYDFDYIKHMASQTIPKEIEEAIAGRRVIASMGRLIPIKNHMQLIDVCHEVFKEIDDTVLIIMGNGELRDSINKHIKDLGEDNRIFLFEYQSNPFPIINAADVFVMATEREGFCNSIVEAMACGTAVVSADCLSGPREIIAGMTEYRTTICEALYCKRGVLVPIKNNGEMLNAIRKVLRDTEYRNECINNATSYIQSFSNDAIKQQWIDLIERI